VKNSIIKDLASKVLFRSSNFLKTTSANNGVSAWVSMQLWLAKDLVFRLVNPRCGGYCDGLTYDEVSSLGFNLGWWRCFVFLSYLQVVLFVNAICGAIIILG